MRRVGAGCGHVVRNVAVGVVEGNMNSIRFCDGEETADSAATLECSVKVESPDVIGRGPLSVSRTMLYPSQMSDGATEFVPAMILETMRP